MDCFERSIGIENGETGVLYLCNLSNDTPYFRND